MGLAYLLTGEPRTGKTTAIKTIVKHLSTKRCGGFYTEELRVDGERVGFRAVTLDGQAGVIAHEDFASPHRVRIYGVDLKVLDSLVTDSIRSAVAAQDIVIVDEIGKMQMFSKAFRRAVEEALDSPRVVLGTITESSTGWTDKLKMGDDVELFNLTVENRQEVTRMVAQKMGVPVTPESGRL